MRSFDKKQNILEANLILEAKNNDDIMTVWLLESCEELGIKINLNEDKELLNEGITMAIIGGALASGKLLDLIGTTFKKIRNFAVRKGWIKGEEWDKTKLETIGEWIHKKIVMGFFKGLAMAILGILSKVTPIEFNKDNIGKLANFLFYASITIVGATAFSGLVSGGILADLGIWGALTEGITASTKLYEVILLIWALILINSKSETLKVFDGKKPVTLSHSLGECLESNGGARVILSKKHWESLKNTLKCAIKEYSSHEHH
jgi:hypothetical protein